jgi:DNA-binding transcriptional LysR family regulator
MDLNGLRDFVAVVTHGGFAPASRAIGTAKSTLSCRVRELEDELGVRLLERTSRRVRLTAEGATLHERGARALAEIDEAQQLLRDQDVTLRGPLRISAPVMFGQLYLGRIAAQYRAAHSDVELEVVADDRRVDLLEEGFDAAICINPRHLRPRLSAVHA